MNCNGSFGQYKKNAPYGVIFNSKQHTDIEFYEMSVLFLVEYICDYKNECTYV